MQNILKFSIRPADIDGDNVLEMPLPDGAQILSIQYQPWSKLVCMWALVDIPLKKQEFTKRRFRVVGTGFGFAATSNYKFISTVQFPEEHLVYHFFEIL